MKKRVQAGPLSDLENAALAAKYGMPPKDPDIGIETTPDGRLIAHNLSASKPTTHIRPSPPDLNVVLAAADTAFTDTQDGLTALGWIALAAKAQRPIPPAIAHWLRCAIQAYQGNSELTLDAALGLNGVGARSPRQRAARASATSSDIARMMELRGAGASIEDAAALVEWVSVAGIKRTALRRQFKSAWTAKDDLARWRPRDIETTLSEYPDHLECQQIKATIRAAYHNSYG